jgi:hypothetical protein
MKRIFLIIAVIMTVMMFMLPCFAEETAVVTSEAVSVDTEAVTVVEGDVNTSTQDWLTNLFSLGVDFLDEYEDRIMAGVLLVAAIIYKAGAATIKKKILPKIEKQGENAMGMITAAGKLTKTNKENFETVIDEVRSILAEDSEREKRLLTALETEHKTTEEYRNMCEQYRKQICEFSSVSLAQSAMIYEALMSAKLTDVRKEEIEKQYLKQKEFYENIVLVIEKGEGENEEEDKHTA